MRCFLKRMFHFTGKRIHRERFTYTPHLLIAACFTDRNPAGILKKF